MCWVWCPPFCHLMGAPSLGKKNSSAILGLSVGKESPYRWFLAKFISSQSYANTDTECKKILERKLVQISKKLREIHSAKAYVSSTPVKGTKWESVSGK